MHFAKTDACLRQAGNSHITYNHLCLCIVLYAHFIVLLCLLFSGLFSFYRLSEWFEFFDCIFKVFIRFDDIVIFPEFFVIFNRHF